MLSEIVAALNVLAKYFQYSIGDAQWWQDKSPKDIAVYTFQYSIGDAHEGDMSFLTKLGLALSILHWRCC